MSGQVYYTRLRMYPQKGAPGNMPFFGQRSRYIYKYSGLGFD
ncbi:MAG: hypothetical protein ACYDEF_00145 [Methanosarcina sp.]